MPVPGAVAAWLRTPTRGPGADACSSSRMFRPSRGRWRGGTGAAHSSPVNGGLGTRWVTRLVGVGFAACMLAAASAARAGQCDGVVVVVDNDDPDSGYAEVNPENFQTHNVDACLGTYRYLSKYVGDESTDGRVTWQPAITVPGTYRVTTSFRASENRTDDADYRLVGDDGQQQAMVVDQRGDGCTEVELGLVWCEIGGSCRLELDGTDDMKSDAADATTFELVDCDPPPPPRPGQCDPLLDAGFEVCAVGPGRCEGVYTGGEGCVALCAAVGMECVARFGGEPGCQQEALEIPCDEVNDHGSNYCVCQGDPPVGTTGTDDGEVTGGGVDDGGSTAADEAGSTGAGASTEAATTDVPGDGSGVTAGALPPGGTGDRGSGTGCACAASTDATGAWWAVFAVAAALRSRRRRSAAVAAIAITTAACAGDVEESAASATATEGSTSSGTTTAVSATDPTSSGSPTSATTDPTETSATTDASTSSAGTESTTTGSETTADLTATDGSSSGAVDESSSTTMSTRGMVCMDDADCDGSAPFCVYNQCRDGSEDDSCLDDNDCVDAPACVYNLCSVGDEYDGCLDDGDCNDGAPDCVYNQCHDGSAFDPCIDDNDCDGAPYCVYNQCRDGVEFDPCLDDGDCDAGAPHCAQTQCHDGSAGDPCDAADDCDNDCGPDLVCG